MLKKDLDITTFSLQPEEVVDAKWVSPEELLAMKPDGIVVSNGPGDPADNESIIAELKKLNKSGIPMFGIALGHQLIALAHGFRTEKLKYGHHGANQPVKYFENGRVYILQFSPSLT